MRHYLFVLFAGLVLCLASCRNDFEFEPSAGGLEFSRDTVYLDTVFTNTGSSTYTLKVYNRSDKDISIPSVKLKKPGSKYRLMVDGMSGQSFSNVELMAKDSMFIFIETTVDVADANPTDFLYTDEIEFYSTSGVQEVHLVTLIQDAIFLYPQRYDDGTYESVPLSDEDPTQLYGFNLVENDPNHGNELEMTAAKPYVIYGMATVPTGKTLNIHPGARLHFHADSGLMVRPGASLNIGNEGDAPTEQNKVVIEGDRLEPGFSDVPGQWLTIWLREGSTGNNLNNLLLKNATVGILMEGNDGTDHALKMRNVEVYNCANVGLLARKGSIQGDNVVMNNAGEASLACTLGGTYRFRHCTFANYTNAYNQVPVIVADNMTNSDGSISVANLDATFFNCIIYGSSSLGIRLSREGEDLVTYHVSFNNSFIKFADSANQYANNPLYKFDNTGLTDYSGSVIARNTYTLKPYYTNPQENDLTITEQSAAKAIGDPAIAALVPLDILGAARDLAAPDAGAYVHYNE